MIPAARAPTIFVGGLSTRAIVGTREIPDQKMIGVESRENIG
jgi:hypothetical protein